MYINFDVSIFEAVVSNTCTIYRLKLFMYMFVIFFQKKRRDITETVQIVKTSKTNTIIKKQTNNWTDK